MRILCGTIIAAAVLVAVSAQSEDFTWWVDPFVGTIGEGNCFPGACRPFGMVQPSPDTGEKTYCGGYKFADTTIRCFSQTHLNGTGRPAMGDVAILPLRKDCKCGNVEISSIQYPILNAIGCDKTSEVAEVGYYAVTLDGGIKCEATATERVALWRITWPEDSERLLYVDAAAMLMQSWNQKLGATVMRSEAKESEDRRALAGGKTALGGREKALAKLDEFFATAPKGRGRNSDEGGLDKGGRLRRGQYGMYWHGNEPSHHIAYLYSLWGRRDKAAALVGRICREAYRPVPEGLCGNDDCGQMSAWYLFSTMGFYPVNPCGDGYVLGDAQAEEIKLRVGSEVVGEFRIAGNVKSRNPPSLNPAISQSQNSTIAQSHNPENPVRKPVLNGKAVDGVKISHEDIMRGGTLEF